MKHEVFFRKHPVFTDEEFVRYLSTFGEMGARTKEALLNYHKKTGHVVHIRQGLYAVVPRGADPVSYPVDPVLVAAKLTKDAVLSHHTALDIHGHAYSVREYLTYSAHRAVAQFPFRSYVIKGVTFSQKLCRLGKEKYGVVTVDRSGLDIQVTSLERTLVDVLDRPDLSGGWEEIWRSLESVEFFDLEKVVEYSLLLGNSTTIAKVGFFLEQHQEPLMVEGSYLNTLRDRRPRQPHYIDNTKRQPGRLVRDWNLVIPDAVLERRWSDVL